MIDELLAARLKPWVSAAFLASWAALVPFGFLLERRWRSAAEARARALRCFVATAALFVLFVTALAVLETRSWSSLLLALVVAAAVVLVQALCWRALWFCDRCGKVYRLSWDPSCRRCGFGRGPDPDRPRAAAAQARLGPGRRARG
jgi:hypothetical protein